MIIITSDNLKKINFYILIRKYVRNKLFGYIYYENNYMSFSSAYKLFVRIRE